MNPKEQVNYYIKKGEFENVKKVLSKVSSFVNQSERDILNAFVKRGEFEKAKAFVAVIAKLAGSEKEYAYKGIAIVCEERGEMKKDNGDCKACRF